MTEPRSPERSLRVESRPRQHEQRTGARERHIANVLSVTERRREDGPFALRKPLDVAREGGGEDDLPVDRGAPQDVDAVPQRGVERRLPALKERDVLAGRHDRAPRTDERLRRVGEVGLVRRGWRRIGGVCSLHETRERTEADDSADAEPSTRCTPLHGARDRRSRATL